MKNVAAITICFAAITMFFIGVANAQSDSRVRYIHARRCYVASIPLLSGGAGVATAGIIILGIGLSNNYEFAPPLIASYVLLGYATLFGIIPGVTLIVHGAKKLNKLADDYNAQRYSSNYQRNVQMNVGLTQNGIGLKLNF